MLQALKPEQRLRIGPYITLARLGMGGMGEVFLARRPGRSERKKLVAVKTLRTDHALELELRARFRREVEAARLVSADSLATLLDYDVDAEPPWLATEYIAGPSLDEAVKITGPLPEQSVRTLGADLAETLRTVHAQRLLHRDIKPGNVLLAHDGPRLIDFGIVKVLGGTVLTRAGGVVGTAGFLSPEHFGPDEDLGPASDVFCLAAVLAYASCGRQPFGNGPTRELLERNRLAQADLSRVPDGLREVLALCLRPRPQDRPDTAELMGLLGSDDADSIWPLAVAELCAGYERDAASLARARGIGRTGNRSRGLVVGLGTSGVALGLVGTLLVMELGLRSGHRGVSSSQGPVRSTGTTAAGTTAAGTTAAAAPPSAMPGADSGASGDFGAAALSVAAVPATWSAWSRQLGFGLGGCALGDGLYLCSRKDGGLVALDAYNGSTRWTLDPHIPVARLKDSAAAAPVLADGVAYTIDGPHVRAVRLSDHSVLWEKQVGSGQIAVSVLLVGKTLVTYLVDPDSPQIGGSGTTDAGALRANAVDDGHELWTTSLQSAGTAPIAVGGQLYAMSGGRLVKVEPQHGAITASAPASCTALYGNGQWLICANTRQGTLESFGAQRLEAGLVLLQNAGRHLALGSSGLLVTDGVQEGAYTAMNLATGETVWSYQTPAEQTSSTTGLLLSGSKVVETTVSSTGIIDLSKGKSAVPTPEAEPSGWPGSRDDWASAGEPSTVLADGLLYAGFPDGTVVSGYAPQ